MSEPITTAYHPSEMERVTPEAVAMVLDAARVGYHRVYEFLPGVVRVDVVGRTAAERAHQQEAICQALRPKWYRQFWWSYWVSHTYEDDPSRSWVIVRDPGLEWTDAETGLDYITLLRRGSASTEQPAQPTPGHDDR